MGLMAEKGMRYVSGKTYTHSVGLSCCFRQWRAQSHCRFMHGYALQVSMTFYTMVLDENNWVVDFGSLKPIKAWLEDTFDHKTLVARDDPSLKLMQELEQTGLIQLRVVDNIGLESFARMIYEKAPWDTLQKDQGRIRLQKVEVKEHEGNWARYEVAD